MAKNIVVELCPYCEKEVEIVEDKIVIETCPHCQREVEMTWDVKKDGFKAYCHYCGERLMICSECCCESDFDCDFNIKTNTCKHNKEGN